MFLILITISQQVISHHFRHSSYFWNQHFLLHTDNSIPLMYNYLFNSKRLSYYIILLIIILLHWTNFCLFIRFICRSNACTYWTYKYYYIFFFSLTLNYIRTNNNNFYDYTPLNASQPMIDTLSYFFSTEKNTYKYSLTKKYYGNVKKDPKISSSKESF